MKADVIGGVTDTGLGVPRGGPVEMGAEDPKGKEDGEAIGGSEDVMGGTDEANV